MQTIKSLSYSLKQSENLNKELSQRIKKLIFCEKIIKNISTFRCEHCGSFIDKKNFIEHLSTCSKNSNAFLVQELNESQQVIYDYLESSSDQIDKQFGKQNLNFKQSITSTYNFLFFYQFFYF